MLSYRWIATEIVHGSNNLNYFEYNHFSYFTCYIYIEFNVFLYKGHVLRVVSNDRYRINSVLQSSGCKLILGLSVCSMSSGISESSGSGSGSGTSQLQNRDFKIVLDIKSGGPQVAVHLVAPTIQVSTLNCKIKLQYSY